MLNFLYDSLESFRNGFSRHRTWLIFSMVTIGFLGTTQIQGVTSFCRFWGLDECGYYTFIHFFRYSSWSMDLISYNWIAFVLSQNVAIMAKGRKVLLGDHTYAPKDGRFMPGVVSLRQDSETQTKPSYFRGHCVGSIGLLIGSFVMPFCLPLAVGIQQGLIHIGINQTSKKDTNRETLCTRILNMALIFCINHNIPATIVLDAYFPCSSVFRLASSVWSIELRQPMLTVIVKAKKNCTAYFKPETNMQKKRGRKRIYGEKVKLMELFDHLHIFKKVECCIYGKIEEISTTTIDLLWKPTGELIRFVLAVTSHGKIILMCSDLDQDPLLALELYSKRIRIEIMFDMLKNLIGAFQYRFWTKYMPRHSRKPKTNKDLKKPLTGINKIKQCWEAYEKFLLIGSISLGLLQLIALKYQVPVWNSFGAYLRTRSRELPSERTVKHVIRRLFINDFLSFNPGAIMREIREIYVKDFQDNSAKKEYNSCFALS